MELIPASGWEDIVAELARKPGTTLLLGGVDMGKSVFAHYLIAQLVYRGFSAALVDADVGQSSLCLPGTVGMKVFKEDEDLDSFSCRRFFFVGTTNPAKSMFQLIAGTRMLTDAAKKAADRIIIDTTGLVTGQIGVGLKISKIRALKPERVIALQRDDECEPILSRLRGITVERLAPSPQVRRRSQETRARYRHEKLAGWFLSQRLREYVIPTASADIFRFGRPISPSDTDLRIGTVIGLNRGFHTVTLGVVTETNSRSITFQAPLFSLRGINRIVYGELAFEPEKL